ncbi:hypothetical protein BGZ61DRAFT_151890 [Ilyonectria robusta]|uniref:uncharacterized protein n=1 Tax=Ilyonectria robusta TaxID=1079257 RepID=UPI001E8EBA52|nr:uncharacterized protein BGZ61DRAFT_151890 [Ilyonectria robusta]KAH8661169.1 hypothetical protein BGZ61DRAFT_151890 [Ilyonectria robusta]
MPLTLSQDTTDIAVPALYPRPNPAYKTPDNWRYRDGATFMRQAFQLAAARSPWPVARGCSCRAWAGPHGSVDGSPFPPTVPSASHPESPQSRRSRNHGLDPRSYPTLRLGGGPEGIEEGGMASRLPLSNPGVIAPRETWSWPWDREMEMENGQATLRLCEASFAFSTPTPPVPIP